MALRRSVPSSLSWAMVGAWLLVAVIVMSPWVRLADTTSLWTTMAAVIAGFVDLDLHHMAGHYPPMMGP
jgi:hypothetical protein